MTGLDIGGRLAAGIRRRLSRGPEERARIDPRTPWWGEDRSRYHFVAPFVRGRRVLDLGCGVGVGTRILEDAGAARATGLDHGPELAPQWQRSRGTFVRGDGTRLPFPAASFDVVVCMEMIEHVPDAAAVIAEAGRVLGDDGHLMLSTPNAIHTRPVDGVPRNPFHVREFRPEELRDLLGETFAEVELFAQRTHDRYPVSPFWQRPEDLPRSGKGHRQVLRWRVLHRMPFWFKDRVSRLLHNRSFYPGEYDFVFDDDLDAGHVVVARCRTPKRPIGGPDH